VLPLNWAEVLDRVAQTLTQAEAEAARAELAAPPAAESASPDPDTAWQAVAARLAERLRQLDDCVARAGQSAEQVESSLQGSETVLRHWLAEAEAVRGRLAILATSQVS